MGVAVITGTLVCALDEVDTESSQGRRHFIKSNRWQVISDPDGYLKDTWLPTAQAKQMLSDGDFYSDGTKIKIYPAGWIVQVRGKKIFDCETGMEVEP